MKMLNRSKLAILHPAVGSSQGGTQSFVAELSAKLDENFDVTILCSKSINSLCKEIKCIPRRTKTNNHLLLKLLSCFTSSPDIVLEHITSFSPLLFELLVGDYDAIFPNNDWGGLLVSKLIRKIKGTPIIFTEHCGLMENNKIAQRNISFKPDKYIALSDTFYKWVKAHYPDVDVEFIPNGVDLNRFNPELKPVELNLIRPIFLTSGRNYNNKRLDLVIKAVSKLGYGSLVILCPDKDTQHLQELGNELLGQERFFLKAVSYDEIPSYYAACDVFTLPSENEPFGLVYLEALACGKPVVAPNDESRRFIIGEAGVLCNVLNIDEYASSLKKALKYTNQGQVECLWRKACSSSVQVEQAEKFSLDKTAQRYTEVITNLLEED